jgi:hypothetical protein
MAYYKLYSDSRRNAVKVIFISLVVLLIFMSFIMRDKQQEYYPSKGEQLINSTLAKAAKFIQEKYNIRPSGVGVAMPGGPIQEVALCFDTKYPYTKGQLRELLIKISQELLDQINRNKKLQEFIKAPPFTIKNVQIIIYNHDKDGTEIYDPNISGAQIAQGVLTFRTVDKSDTFRFKNQFEESYDEALKALSKP